MMSLLRLAATGVGLAARLGIASFTLRACRNQAIVAFKTELRKAGLPPDAIAELCDLYPRIDLSSLRQRIPPRA